MINCSNEGTEDVNPAEDCGLSNPPEKSETNTQNGLTPVPYKQIDEDCSNSLRLSISLNEKVPLFSCKKNQKYYPHFKAKVIGHALKYSLKNAAETFKVNKDTVSDWVRQYKQYSSKDKAEQPLVQVSINPGEQFLRWLKTLDKSTIVSRECLVKKATDILNTVSNETPDKKNLWFFRYAKRLQNENSSDKMQIKYPPEFKQELIEFTSNFSQNKISKVFGIHRKRLFDWIIEQKNVNVSKKRDTKKYLTDPVVDERIWNWYSSQEEKPESREVRKKAVRMYQEAGFPEIQCSHNWYLRWRLRHNLPPARLTLAARDSELLSWALQQLDQNKSINHSDLLNQALLFKGSKFKASPSWVFRFSKRHMSGICPGSKNFVLPEKLLNEANQFKTFLLTKIANKNLKPHNIVAFDELPLNFLNTDNNSNLLGKNGWDNCQASIIIACIANGCLIPTCLILKKPLENIIRSEESLPVFVQSSGVNDDSTIEQWLHHLLKYIAVPSVVICDAYDPHLNLRNVPSKYFMPQDIEFSLIPAGCSMFLQPILYGIAEKFKNEITSSFKRWSHDHSNPGSLQIKLPSENDIYEWVTKAHSTIASTCQEEIGDAFVKAGYWEGPKT